MLADLAIGWLQHEVMLLLHAPFSMQPVAMARLKHKSKRRHPTPPQLAAPAAAPVPGRAGELAGPSAHREGPTADREGPPNEQESPSDEEEGPLHDKPVLLDDRESPLNDRGSPSDDGVAESSDREAASTDRDGRLSSSIGGGALHSEASGGSDVGSGGWIPSGGLRPQRTAESAPGGVSEMRHLRQYAGIAAGAADESIPLGRGRRLLRLLRRSRAQLAVDAAAAQAEVWTSSAGS